MTIKTAQYETRLKQRSSLGDLRIADLELFITTAHLKNLGKAASIHHLSQSAASAAILRVEEALSISLCTHERRQFQLTKEGSLFLPIAESWLKFLQDALNFKEHQPIRLATTHAIGRACIASILPFELIDLKLMRPDKAYAAILKDEADIAIVIDNMAWEGVEAKELGKGSFQLFSKQKEAPIGPVLLPEDQIEVLTLQQKWAKLHGFSLSVKARLPSWSLIADICSQTNEIGFLPDFLAKLYQLSPVSWQPETSHYRILALYRKSHTSFQKRLDLLMDKWTEIFSKN